MVSLGRRARPQGDGASTLCLMYVHIGHSQAQLLSPGNQALAGTPSISAKVLSTAPYTPSCTLAAVLRWHQPALPPWSGPLPCLTTAPGLEEGQGTRSVRKGCSSLLGMWSPSSRPPDCRGPGRGSVQRNLPQSEHSKGGWCRRHGWEQLSPRPRGTSQVSRGRRGKKRVEEPQEEEGRGCSTRLFWNQSLSASDLCWDKPRVLMDIVQSPWTPCHGPESHSRSPRPLAAL